jgi:hypothetical protein
MKFVIEHYDSIKYKWKLFIINSFENWQSEWISSPRPSSPAVINCITNGFVLQNLATQLEKERAYILQNNTRSNGF